MLTIKILGGGCPNCKKLEAITRSAVEALGVEAEFIKVTSTEDIMNYPILSTPGLVINEKLLSQGRIPDAAEIGEWVKAVLAA